MSVVVTLPPRFSADQVLSFVDSHYEITTKDVKELGSYIDQNFLIESDAGELFVLKIHDAAEQESVLDFQNKTMQHLSTKMNHPAFPKVIQASSGAEIISIEANDGSSHWVRLLSFVQGSLLKDIDHVTPPLLDQIGQVLGEMDKALLDFRHAAENRPDIPWDLKNASSTQQLSQYLGDHHHRRLAEYFFLQFDTQVAPVLCNLRKSVVHNDTHRYSILVNSEQEISGIIDFGDAVYTHTICNLAVSISDIMTPSENPIADAVEVISGYHKVFPLMEEELSILFYLICTRLSIYGCMSAYSESVNPGNEHAQIKTRAVWDLLQKLIAINPLYANDEFRKACGMTSLLDSAKQNTEDNLQSRQKHFPASLYTHYAEPVSLAKGGLQYLFDDTGKTYLDCVNNVCQWGHCHPRIVRAGQKQLAELNTNSRYVYTQMTAYAERLVSTLPDRLNVCFLVNSGSEANDLALQLARTYTGEDDIVVIDTAYHGNSTVCTEISPNRIDRTGGPGLPRHVHKIPVPDTLRGIYQRDDPEAGKHYASHVQPILEQLASRGKAPAAFIAESLIGTGGQFVLPEGYLEAVYARIRQAGGVCIADEVQVGFGRTGSHMWCFESQNVTPDIVTMGKPIANGYPMGALVTTQEIADAFDNGITYFNTFGGNPVSCAIGLAVLDVLEDENLQENTLMMGGLLMDGLKRLMSKHSIIADVRGQGLYIGIELVDELDDLTPATRQAKVVVEEMKSRGILLNTNGYSNNIIKIKPPLIISQSDVELILSTFDSVFDELK